MEKLILNGIKLAYSRHGKGISLVLLHGILDPTYGMKLLPCSKTHLI